MAKQHKCGEVLMAALLINKTFKDHAKGKKTIAKEDAVKLLSNEMGEKVTKTQLEEVFKTLDADGSGALDFQEFLSLVGSTALMFNEMMSK